MGRWLRGDGRIRIARDEHGVPHVLARAQEDLYRGLGHCHARDRAVQMLLVRILGQGRAAEILRGSDELLTFDRFFRRLNLGGDADAEARKLSPHHRKLAEAYCSGVNRGLGHLHPLVLRVLGHRPEPWTVADCVLTSRVMGYVGLAQSQAELERLVVEMIHGGVPRGHLEELFPGVLDDLDVGLVRRIDLADRLVPAALRWSGYVPRAVASNAWALSGARTRSGRALLANDPHLDVNRLPAVWYEIALSTDARYCLGATVPGLPAVVIGRTNDVAWGVTYSCMDAHDAWIEDCRDGRYRRIVDGREQWLPFRARTEVVKRKRKPDVWMTFFENEHGALEGDPFTPGLYVTSRWSAAAGTGAATLEAAFDLITAPDARAALEALGRIETAWNWVAADRHGSVGCQMSGLMPVRRPGAHGVAPGRGWEPGDDWRGFVDPADLPRAVDPPGGFVVSANHDVNNLGRARPITVPMGPQRAERIAELLDRRDGWTVEDSVALQNDVFSRQAETFMAVLRPLLPRGRHGDIVRAWDLRYEVDSTGAYLFERFYRALVFEVFGAVCGPEVLRFLVDETGLVAGFYDNLDRVLLDPDSKWYGSDSRDEVWTRVAQRSLRGPLKTWGEHQRFTFSNLLLAGKLPRWLGFDLGPVPLRGTRATVHQGQTFVNAGRRVAVAPAYRFIADFKDELAHTSLPGGASEKRASRWYTSGIADWLAGRTKTLAPRVGSGGERD